MLSKSSALLPPLPASTTGIHFSTCLRRRAGRLRQERAEGTPRSPLKGDLPALLKSGTHSNARCVVLEAVTEDSHQSLH